MKDSIYYAHLVQKRKGQIQRHPAGRFMIKDNHVHHLEDHYGLLDRSIPEGYVDDLIEHRLQHPGRNLSVTSHDDLVNGRRMDFIPEHPLHDAMPIPNQHDPKQGKPSVFHYHRAGFDRPHLIEVKDGKFLLDGSQLKEHEIKAVLDNVKSGVAKLKYPKAESQALKKAEASFDVLSKSEGDEMDPQEALAHLDSLNSNDPQTQRAIASVRRQIFMDPMTGLGNKYAYGEFLKKNPEGYHVMVDGNGMKAVNDTYGHEAGDQLIQSFGHAMRSAADEVSPKQAKLHRFGGDELHAFLPTAEHAHHFARSLREKLDALPPINGTHKISASIGVGKTPEHADNALYQAKAAKAVHLATGGKAHDVPTFIHSNVGDVTKPGV